MPAAESAQRAAYVEQVMGLPWSLHVRGPNARAGQTDALVREVFRELHRLDGVFSTYQPGSDVSRIARGELEVADADPTVAEVLALARLAEQRTGGLFRVQLPGREGAVSLDPSGIVKGWAAQRAFAALDVLRDDDVCLNAGGDVVVRLATSDGEPGGGHRADRRPAWQVGIERPDGTGVLTALALSRGAVATSGTGARGAHLVDPRTGLPAGAVAQVSVTGPSLMWADVLATAAFVRGADAAAWIRGQVGYDALVVHLDGTLSASPGWSAA